MNKSKVLFKEEARKKYLQGARILADAVGTSLGPKGRNVGISRVTPDGMIYERTIIHDGVNIAKAIDLKDEDMNFGVAIIREAAQKTVDIAGDGTTLTIVLANAILEEGEKRVSAGEDPMTFIKELESDVKLILDNLDKKSQKISTLEQKIQVATISSEEESLGKLIGETIHKIGNTGVVTVDFSKNDETMVEHQEGMNWDKGLASPYFITDPDNLSGIIENAAILVTDYEINNFQTILPLINNIIQKNKFFAIIAPSFGGDALPSLILNKQKGVFVGLCVKAPSFGSQQTNMLADIAALTGANFIAQETGKKLEEVTVDDLGFASHIASSQFSSLIRGGSGQKEIIQGRIDEIKKLLDKSESDFEKKQLKERLAKLTGGVAVIKVGGITEVEMKERYERALDAVLSTRKAVEGGIIAGGETAFLDSIDKVKSPILKHALVIPFKKLMENAGMDGGQMLERIMKEEMNTGIDVMDGKMKDMLKAGIIDAVDVQKQALINAISVALRLLTTEVLINPILKENGTR